MTEIGNQTNSRELTIDESGRLEELEIVIAENFQGFYAVGCALAEINASRLYRQAHVTFEDYCRERFEISRQSAYRYIEAKKAMDNLSPIGRQTDDNLSAAGGQKLLPLNERQIRPLTRLESDAQAEAWDKVVASAPTGGGITAKHVAEVVANILGATVKKKAEKIKKDMEPAVSDNFHNALWELINVVRDEIREPLKAKRKKIMIESLQSVERLLAE